VRLAVVAVWIVFLVVALLPFLRRRRLPSGAGRVSSDELVKDPVCQTYIVRSRAVSRESAEGPRYFCSLDCARRFAGG
jgi:YHS domain-containing protein